MISESNPRTTFTPKWLNLMNTSVDNLPFEVKLDKAKLGLDSATIKFLPLILKTLKKHKYFDKMLEETSSQNPLDDKMEQTDHNMYDKNIFSDTRNWMRVPTSRLYTIEYKTSPIVYFKSPTRNTDYFTKVRKIRDYQRIMNYVDKMISERVTFGSTVPMNKNIYRQKNFIATDYTTPMTKTVDYSRNTQSEHTRKPKTASQKDKPHCSCPKRINDLLTKLIHSLQKLLPNFTDVHDKPLQVTKPCKHRNTKLLTEMPFKPHLESTTKSYSYLTPNVVAVTSKPHRTQATTISLPELDYTLSAIIHILKPDLYIRNKNIKSKLLLKTTTTKNYVEGTDREDKVENTTQTMNNLNTAKLYNSVTTVRDYILNSNSDKTTQTFLTYPNEYEDYVATTPRYISNNYKKLDEHNLKSVKRKMITKTKGQTLNQIEDKRLSNAYPEIKVNNLSTITTTGNSDITWALSDKTKPLTTEVVTTKIFSDSKTDFKTESLTNQEMKDINKIDQMQKSEDITLEEEIEKTSPEDVTAEENLKNLENIINTLNSSDIYINNNKTTTEVSELYEWELIKVEDTYDNNDIFTKSMIPKDKASYLEIQRNDWKQDEDFDNNINHYLFE